MKESFFKILISDNNSRSAEGKWLQMSMNKFVLEHRNGDMKVCYVMETAESTRAVTRGHDQCSTACWRQVNYHDLSNK